METGKVERESVKTVVSTEAIRAERQMLWVRLSEKCPKNNKKKQKNPRRTNLKIVVELEIGPGLERSGELSKAI